MKAEDQRIAIAEACGWGWDPRYKLWHGPSMSEGNTLPDYLRDLNAMHEAEKVLTEEQRQEFLGWVCTQAEFSTPEEYHWFLAHATAAQRAEAFLRTLGRYQPTGKGGEL